MRTFIRKYIVVVFLLAVGGAGMVRAQEVTATASVDTNAIKVGGQVNLRLELHHPANVNVEWPALTDSLQGIEIVQLGKPGRKVSTGDVVDTASLVITAFDSGTVAVPPLPFSYTTPGDTVRKTVFTQSISIFVQGVAVDTSQEIKEIKGPRSVPITWADVWPWLLGVIVVAGLGWLVMYILRKRRKGESIIPEAPRRPAHEIALDALRSLESEKMWQRGLVKEYHSKLTDILRMYIEQRYSVMALEMTTEEIMEGLKNAPISSDVRGQLKDILVRADFAKFAKFQPDPKENELSLTQGTAFVQATWRMPIQTPQTSQATQIPQAQEVAGAAPVVSQKDGANV